jgi:AraC-like DNA-binding protein
MSSYIQFLQPAGVLQKYINHYYIVELSGGSGMNEFEQKPISNGCVEMFIGYHNTIGTCYTNNGNTLRIRSAVVGAHDLKNSVKGIAFDFPPETFKFVSICFKPEGFYEIFKIPTFEIYNSFVDTNDLFGNDIKELQNQMDDANDINERKTYLDQYFINQVEKNNLKHYTFSSGLNTIDIINFYKGMIKMPQLADEIKVSERTIQRNFKTALGISPKEYCKIIRFKNLLDYINQQPRINWFDMVSLFGYYDQAHLINEFKSATGITPEVFIKYRNKSVFKVDNHLVIIKPNLIQNEVSATMTNGEASYKQYTQHEVWST